MKSQRALVVLVVVSAACSGTLGVASSGDGGNGTAAGDMTVCIDDDGDGYYANCGPLDCNDHDPTVHPGAPEFCDGVDRNCDGHVNQPGCLCVMGATKACYSGAPATANVGACKDGLSTCDGKGAWGACTGEVTPQKETCNGVDDDCDGVVDNGVKNACGGCGPVPMEICGNGLDDDCNGVIDDGCATCDPQCQCNGASDCTCSPPTHQPCYDGPPATAGVGACHEGFHDCVSAGGKWMWSACTGEQKPTAPICDGGDHDCDGQPDTGGGCLCVAGAVKSCGSSVGACKPGTQSCSNGQWSTCAGGVAPKPEVCNGVDDDCNGVVDDGVTNACGGCGPVPMEVCGNGLDDNCNGVVDENCMCQGGATEPCYAGPAKTRNLGACHDGLATCLSQEVGSSWGACTGQQLPMPEVCGDGIDNDCDGTVDNGCPGVCNPGDVRACGSSVGECRPGTQTCTKGAWGACMGNVGPQPEVCDGKDNDCNGLVDDGVLNACGTCPPAPCFTEDWAMPGVCTQADRQCNAVVPDPNNPNAITLGQSTNQLLPFIYLAVTNKNMVAQINTQTLQKMWEVPTYGILPSRTAVALDGSVWVGNRCLVSGRENDYTCSNMVHLDLNGNLICRADVAGWIRGVAIDADGNVWAGAYNGMEVWKVDGTSVDATQSPPRCKVLAQVPLGIHVYGVAIDGRGYLWTSSPDGKAAKVDVKAAQVVAMATNPWSYGIAIDGQNRVWFGGWLNNGPMHRMDGDPPYAIAQSQLWGVTGVTVHPDGSAWGSRYDIVNGGPRGVVKITMDNAGNLTNQQYFADPDQQNIHGIAVDKDNYVWSPQRFTGYALRWSSTGQLLNKVPVDPGNELYSYSDMTGLQLRTITSKEGHWIQDFDSGYTKPYWDHLAWTDTVPAGTSVTVEARAADSEAQFAAGQATQWCGPFNGIDGANTADLKQCPFLGGHRWLEVDVKLATQNNGVRPTVSDVQAIWSY